MKKIRTTAWMVLGAIVMVAFVGCTKDNENNGGNNGGGNNNGNTYNGHEYVDLGLPSGNLWATCNVGATSPEGLGSYFAWGETSPKENYNWATYKWCKGESHGFDEWGNYNWDARDLTKYCNDSNYGYNGFTDNLTVLQPSDDAATANWGNGWHTPTMEEWRELFAYTSFVGSFQNNVSGLTLTSANGNSIILPYTGEIAEDGWKKGNGYWSSTVRIPEWEEDGPNWATTMDGHMYGSMFGSHVPRYMGLTVRPVRSAN